MAIIGISDQADFELFAAAGFPGWSPEQVAQASAGASATQGGVGIQPPGLPPVLTPLVVAALVKFGPAMVKKLLTSTAGQAILAAAGITVAAATAWLASKFVGGVASLFTGGDETAFGIRGLRKQTEALGQYKTPTGREVIVSQTSKGRPYVAKAEVLRVYGRVLSATEYAAEFGVFPSQKKRRWNTRGFRQRRTRRWYGGRKRGHWQRRLPFRRAYDAFGRVVDRFGDPLDMPPAFR